MIVTIHQLENAPWLGLLDKISKADLFVVANTFSFKKNYFENRNRILDTSGAQWLSIPVESHNHKPMNEIQISKAYDWKSQYLNQLKQCYSKTPYFNTYYPTIEKIILSAKELLWEVNYKLMIQILEWFKIKTEVVLASSLNLTPELRSSERLLEICQQVMADTYLSGPSGKDYLDENIFEINRIKVIYHEFVHPIYKQQSEEFYPNMSSIDYLFNQGGDLKLCG